MVIAESDMDHSTVFLRGEKAPRVTEITLGVQPVIDIMPVLAPSFAVQLEGTTRYVVITGIRCHRQRGQYFHRRCRQ